MSSLRREMFARHEVVIAAAQIIEDVNTNDLWDESKYNVRLKIT